MLLINRRDFFKKSAGILATLNTSLTFDSLLKTTKKGIVIISKEPILNKKGISLNDISNWLDNAIIKLTKKSNAYEAWRTLFTDQDFIGIKLNCLAGKRLSSSPFLVSAIVKSLKKANIDEKRVILWDRTTRELKRAGFSINLKSDGPRCFGTDMVGYELNPEIYGSIGSCFSKIVTRLATVLINVPVIKDHDIAGVSLGMKNFFGAIHNPNKYHDNVCNPYIPDLSASPHIKRKLRLIIMDGTSIQFHGGPAYNKKWNKSFGKILVSLDPVAIDMVGYQLIEAIRKKAGLPSLSEEHREPVYIKTAEEKGLGIANQAKIRRIIL
ncbi:MAG: hypothetical protein DRG20_02335 [Deltaproteobacteria bacterium]|nr:MAG: hypothetical protein DRG20_02335 [Deltaproteobacteria bacterium]